MAQDDFYKTLDVPRNASPEEIKKAYRRLAMKYHPDQNPGDTDAEKKFKAATQAYEVLKDEQQRAAYDRFGHAAFQQAAGGMGGAGAAGFGNAGGGFGFSGDVGDIFEEIFGGFAGGRPRGRSRADARGADLRYDLDVSLAEAYSGVRKKIRIRTAQSCDACNGSGARKGTGRTRCTTCEGTGAVRMQQGFFSMQSACPDCQGAGEVIENPCPQCRGSGQEPKERTLTVKIPAGVDDGTRIRLAQEGNAGPQGHSAGDLYIFIRLQPHEFWQRDGADLYCTAPITITQAALGGDLELRLLNDKSLRVKIPEAMQSGQRLRLRGKGMPVLNGRGVGDMYVTVQVETPRQLNAKQRALLKEFESVSTDDTHPRTTDFQHK